MSPDTEQKTMANRRGSDIMTVGEVGKLFRVAPRTVAKWFDRGLLPGYRIPGGLDRRFHKHQVMAFGVRHGMLLPDRPFVVAYAVLPPMREAIGIHLGDRAELRQATSFVAIVDAIQEGASAVLVDTAIGAMDAEQLLRAIPKSGRHDVLAFGAIDVPPIRAVRWLGRVSAEFIAGALAESLPAARAEAASHE
jgi:excisionase family DNA binding protein